MNNPRRLLASLCLASALSGWAVHATAADDPPPAGGCGAREWRHGHEGGPGEMRWVLHELNLSADQKAAVKAIMAGEKGRFDALHESARANRQALATKPPTDPGYAALVETETHNAAARIALEYQSWKQIYESVLTPQQQQQIPGIASGMGDWKARHAPPP